MDLHIGYKCKCQQNLVINDFAVFVDQPVDDMRWGLALQQFKHFRSSLARIQRPISKA